MTNLDELRREIDGIDDQLLTLLGRRIEIGRAVARSKAPNGGVPAPRPEAAILRRLSAAARRHRAGGDQRLAANSGRQPGPANRRHRRHHRRAGQSWPAIISASAPKSMSWPMAGGDRSGRRWRRVGGRDLCAGAWWQDLCNGDTPTSRA